MSVPNLLDTSVGDLVAERPDRARVFDALKIDYCCGGGRSLREAAEAKDLDPDAVVAMVSTPSGPDETPAETWTDRPLDQLIEHIIGSHHNFLRSELPRLSRHFERVEWAHGEEATWVSEARGVFTELRDELVDHMRKEEEIVFPLIQAAAKGSNGPDTSELDTDPLHQMIEEHDEAGDALQKLRRLSNDYTPPEWACPTFRALINGLRDLESDMHRHVHKENHILFPRARAILN
ncbi:iron-sulfur cluster repair di-iron protein [Longibacter salinarum]|uniref:Iron-sulfur cluster repair di-iron protein n=1 Tax=Longibacter salinarum TaxID=1850348 RepID=A0A2A8CUV8_9BACT|nr:iron-sulfur cluster repair di-iron protein [Longibacter salinarum]PEN11331.1 iron-sulfur cluster repair di-iron protein [Longibacter salinarum]